MFDYFIEDIEPCREKTRRAPKQKFSNKEDEIIKKLAEKFPNNWRKIASLIGNNRSARQIKERYTNYLRPGIDQRPWTSQEDAELICLFKLYGPAWTKIVSYFQNRSVIQVKNRHRLLVRHKVIPLHQLSNSDNYNDKELFSEIDFDTYEELM